MCHYRGSYVSDDKAKADRQKELETARTQAVTQHVEEYLRRGVYNAPPERGILFPRAPIGIECRRSQACPRM